MKKKFRKHSPPRRRWTGVRALAAALASCGLPAAALSQTIVVDYFFEAGIDIADVGLATDIRSIQSGIGSIADVDVYLNISGRGEGGFNGEIYAQLSHGGAAAVLLNRPGSEARGFGYSDSGGFDVTLDDEAAQDIHWYRDAGTPEDGQKVTGAFQPDGRNPLGDPVFNGEIFDRPRSHPLSKFDGLSGAGDWILTVADEESGGTLHRLESWGVQITGEAPQSGETTFSPGTSVTASGGTTVFGSTVNMAGDTRISGGQVDFTGRLTLSASSEFKTESDVRLLGGVGESGGARGLTKSGGGVLTIEGEATHTGSTRIKDGKLIVNGAITLSETVIENGGTLGGSGSLGRVTLESGGIISPGNSVGSIETGAQIWQGGARAEWELNDAEGIAGGPEGWDYISINGILDIQATAGNPVFISLATLTLGQLPGLAENFDPSSPYSWLFVSATGGVTGFASAAFVPEPLEWGNAREGVFSVSLAGGNLYINYTPVPEPEDFALIAGISLLGFAAWRKRHAAAREKI